MRIVSLLPAATELACALDLTDQIVGISFECNYPPHVTDRPRVVDTKLDTKNLTPAEIDTAVSKHLRHGQSLYAIDEKMLARLKPDIILTQDLCQVCAPSGNELSQALKQLPYTPQVIFMSPHSLFDVEENLRELARTTRKESAAEEIIASWHRRRWEVEARASRFAPPRVFMMEWTDPVYCAGHWLGEMIECAGGRDRFARPREDSVRVKWEEIVHWQPEVLVVAPCGYDLPRAETQIRHLTALPGWNDIPAVQNGRVHAVDADAYFVRPGPRLMDGLEMLCNFFEDAAAPTDKP